jgi:hypothetical protein
MIKRKSLHRTKRRVRGGKKFNRTHSKKRGLFGRLFVPVGFTLNTANNVSRTATNTVRDVLHTGIGSVKHLGESVTNRADKAISNMIRTKTRRRRH